MILCYIVKLKKDVLKATTEGIVKLYRYTREGVKNTIKLSNLEWSITIAPDMISH